MTKGSPRARNASIENKVGIRPQIVPYKPENRKWCFGDDKTVFAGGAERQVHRTNNFLYNLGIYWHLTTGGTLPSHALPYMQAMVDDLNQKHHLDEILRIFGERYPDLLHDLQEDARDFGVLFNYRGPLWDSEEPRARPFTLAEQEWTSSQSLDGMIEIATGIDPQAAVWTSTSAEEGLNFFCA